MENNTQKSDARILLVDDDKISSAILKEALSRQYEVKMACSGEECLQVVDDYQPSLIVMDIEMPGINGYDTCRKLQETLHGMPVIFMSAHDTLEELLEAYDAGGEDFLSKPTEHKLLLRKIKNALQAQKRRDELANEMESYEHMAMTFLDGMGENGVLLNFARSNFDCPDYATLLENIYQTTRILGLICDIQLRSPGDMLTRTLSGQPSALDDSVMKQVCTMGHLFHFKKRLVTNFDFVTILVKNMPDDAEVAGRYRDNIAILAEIADAFVRSITLRLQSMNNAEIIHTANISAGSAIGVLRDNYRHQQAETRMMLEELITEVERTYIFLGLTDAQEKMVSEVLNRNTEKVLQQFEKSVVFEQQFAVISSSLN